MAVFFCLFTHDVQAVLIRRALRPLRAGEQREGLQIRAARGGEGLRRDDALGRVLFFDGDGIEGVAMGVRDEHGGFLLPVM